MRMLTNSPRIVDTNDEPHTCTSRHNPTNATNPQHHIPHRQALPRPCHRRQLFPGHVLAKVQCWVCRSRLKPSHDNGEPP
jgi:hypothetical protein